MSLFLKRADGVQCKDFDVKIEPGTEDGEFVGYGSIFGNVDAYREIVEEGAFSASIAEIEASGRSLPILWNHNSSEPLGYYTSLEQDDKGLKVRGCLLSGEVSRAGEIWALLKAGAISGLSIGYYIKGDSYDEETRIRTLTELKLREISLVTFPANDEARVETIKMKLAGGTLPTRREFERVLRDAGFSKSVSARIAAQGYTDLDGQRDADVSDAAVSNALNSAIAQFKSAPTQT